MVRIMVFKTVSGGSSPSFPESLSKILMWDLLLAYTVACLILHIHSKANSALNALNAKEAPTIPDRSVTSEFQNNSNVNSIIDADPILTQDVIDPVLIEPSIWSCIAIGVVFTFVFWNIAVEYEIITRVFPTLGRVTKAWIHALYDFCVKNVNITPRVPDSQPAPIIFMEYVLSIGLVSYLIITYGSFWADNFQQFWVFLLQHEGERTWRELFSTIKTYIFIVYSSIVERFLQGDYRIIVTIFITFVSTTSCFVMLVAVTDSAKFNQVIITFIEKIGKSNWS